ncbi:DUF3883 domain-containing protein [Filobacillus milosensis]|uniref:DUF3883 domain-containing protein n=1 Tax=Filobacillus milosensis TaxID=94137 RepID=A0A4Y8IKZ7_9BACI|nr:DUF3883 domain-containing protein [Filobacillus milosensis]TFB21800.1 DUF3883 domain-containing protein [Filobacillus milosensis]
MDSVYVPYDEENVDYWREEQGECVTDIGLDYLYEDLPNDHIGSENYIENEYLEMYELKSFKEDLSDMPYRMVDDEVKSTIEEPYEMYVEQKIRLFSGLTPIQIKYLKKHKRQMEIGDYGEECVYQHEKTKLLGTKYYNMIDKTKANNPSNGYDILSYTKDGTPLYIEVKTSKNIGLDFHITPHQLKVATYMRNQGMKYMIYFIKDVYSDDPKFMVIDDILEESKYHFEPTGYRVKYN